jgi:hypothetical protein
MAIRYPMEYELNPKSVAEGARWLTLTLKNIGADDLTGLDVRLNSLDAYSVGVFGTGSYVALLSPNQERVLAFQVWANSTGSLYVTIDGWKNGESFYWESPAIWLRVGKEPAELVSLFALTEPYPVMGERIRCEATIRGLAPSEGLELEFWANTPSGKFEELATIETKALSVGEEARYSAEIEPDETGAHTIYAYLYDGVRRIGRETDLVYVTEA